MKRGITATTSTGVTQFRTRKLLSPARGTVAVFGWFLVVLLAGGVVAGIVMGLLFAMFFTTGATGGIIAGYIVAGLVGLSLSFFAGLPFERGGWLMGLSYAVVVLFVVLPIVSYSGAGGYLWVKPKEASVLYAVAAFVIVASIALGHLGSFVNRRKNIRFFHLEKPYVSIAPLISLCLVVSFAIPLVMHYNEVTGETLRSSEYHFEVKVPGGWKVSEELKNLEGAAIGGALAGYKLSQNSKDILRRGDINIAVFDKIYHTTTSVSSFTNAQDCYKALLAEYAKEAKEGRDRTITKCESITLGGLPAIRYWKGSGDINKYTGTIEVYKYPYVYSIFMYMDKDDASSNKTYNEVINSFKLI